MDIKLRDIKIRNIKNRDIRFQDIKLRDIKVKVIKLRDIKIRDKKFLDIKLRDKKLRNIKSEGIKSCQGYKAQEYIVRGDKVLSGIYKVPINQAVGYQVLYCIELYIYLQTTCLKFVLPILLIK